MQFTHQNSAHKCLGTEKLSSAYTGTVAAFTADGSLGMIGLGMIGVITDLVGHRGRRRPLQEDTPLAPRGQHPLFG